VRLTTLNILDKFILFIKTILLSLRNFNCRSSNTPSGDELENGPAFDTTRCLLPTEVVVAEISSTCP
jgi:hypothetical protein